jgi:putative Mn2+ efflux pump MntP
VALLLVAVSLGLSNFAAAVGIGVTGIDARTRLRVGLIFSIFETAMPITSVAQALAAQDAREPGSPRLDPSESVRPFGLSRYW